MVDRRTVVAIVALGFVVRFAALAVPATSGAEALQAPVLGVRETVTRVSGTVLVRRPGSNSQTTLSGALSVPDGSEVDVSDGRVEVTVATTTAGQTATALVYGGEFLLHQEAAAPGATSLTLSQVLACGPTKRSHVARAASAKRKRRPAKSRHIWVAEKEGEWGTNGRYVSTTVEGTRWLTNDQCGRSAVAVAEGKVLVHDLISNRSVTVTAGHRYVAVEEGSALLPPPGQVLAGVSGGSAAAFGSQVGKHPAVYGYFATWGDSLRPALADARGAHARLLLHVSTDVGYGGEAGEVTSPGAIASGASDGYLIRVGEELSESNRPAYVALLPEMNQANNAYSAFSPSGSARDGAHSTTSFRQAWRRSALIVRGGSVASIDRRLRAIGLPPVRTSAATLATPRVALMWAPQTAGTPDTPANEPAAYYPGSAYVDIVGTDFYSAFPNFAGL
ncbi:MAG TPA: hypothetical protein VK761_01085, partial [Solirubrobacteraceae bacterium]|nr:hypothetical protein [Solirubrobacteraceae bacterium]